MRSTEVFLTGSDTIIHPWFRKITIDPIPLNELERDKTGVGRTLRWLLRQSERAIGRRIWGKGTLGLGQKIEGGMESPWPASWCPDNAHSPRKTPEKGAGLLGHVPRYLKSLISH